jgi:hypothetical protein
LQLRREGADVHKTRRRITVATLFVAVRAAISAFSRESKHESVTNKPVYGNRSETLLAPLRHALEAPGVLTFAENRNDEEAKLVHNKYIGAFCLFMGSMVFGEAVLVFARVGPIAEKFKAGLFLGVAFVVIGYCMVFSVRARVDIYLWRRRWVHHSSGIRPFTQRTEGSTDEWDAVHFARENYLLDDGEGGKVKINRRFVRLIARAGNPVPPMLPGFVFPCEIVSRAEALALAQQFAQKLDLPLHEEAEAQ